VTSFDPDGFSVGNNTNFNQSAGQYVAFLLQQGLPAVLNTNSTINTEINANDAAGYSVGYYVGNGTSGATIGHGLSATPDLVFVRNTQITGNTLVVGSPLIGTGKYIIGTGTSVSTGAESFQAFDATTLTFGNLANLNASGRGYMLYAFRSTDNIKVGITAGDGSGTVATNLGFRPAFFYLKSISGTANNHTWYFRLDAGDGSASYVIVNNSTTAPGVSGLVNITSTGFEIAVGGAGNNGVGSQAIYFAVR
jgi:hypothetical protein